MAKIFRHPQTFGAFKLQAQAAIEDDLSEVKINGRKKRALRNEWDDINPCCQRSWKKFRSYQTRGMASRQPVRYEGELE